MLSIFESIVFISVAKVKNVFLNKQNKIEEKLFFLQQISTLQEKLPERQPFLQCTWYVYRLTANNF
jgi:hypothetical protein